MGGLKRGLEGLFEAVKHVRNKGVTAQVLTPPSWAWKAHGSFCPATAAVTPAPSWGCLPCHGKGMSLPQQLFLSH